VEETNDFEEESLAILPTVEQMPCPEQSLGHVAARDGRRCGEVCFCEGWVSHDSVRMLHEGRSPGAAQ